MRTGSLTSRAGFARRAVLVLLALAGVLLITVRKLDRDDGGKRDRPRPDDSGVRISVPAERPTAPYVEKRCETLLFEDGPFRMLPGTSRPVDLRLDGEGNVWARIVAMSRDSEPGLWMFPGGSPEIKALRYGTNPFDGRGPSYALPFASIHDVCASAASGAGTYWIGTRDGGIVRSGPTGWQVLWPNDGGRYAFDWVKDLVPVDGTVVAARDLAHQNNLVWRWEGSLRTWVRLGWMPWIRGLRVTRSGSLLAFSHRTVSEIRGQHWIPRTAREYEVERVEEVYEDASGRLWLATGDGAIAVDRQGNEERHELDGRRVSGFAEDGEGRLWAATLDAGLFLRTDDGWRNLGYDAGLPHERILGLIAGRNGLLWCALDSGIAVVPATVAAAHAIDPERARRGSETDVRARFTFLGRPVAGVARMTPGVRVRHAQTLRETHPPVLRVEDSGFEMRGLEAGDYLLDVDVIPDPSCDHAPGTYRRVGLPFRVSGASAELRDVPLAKHLHLLEPFDNLLIVQHGPAWYAEAPVFPSPVRLAWEPLGEGVEYRWSVARVEHGPEGETQAPVLSEATREAFARLDLPAIGGDAVYALRLEAFAEALLVGECWIMACHDHGYGPVQELRFRVRR